MGVGSGLTEGSAGKRIQVSGPTGHNWQVSLEHILKKDWGDLIGESSWKEFNDMLPIPISLTSQVFSNSPLHDIPQTQRGNFLDDWVRSFDEDTSDPLPSYCCNGVMRGRLSKEMTTIERTFELR